MLAVAGLDSLVESVCGGRFLPVEIGEQFGDFSRCPNSSMPLSRLLTSMKTERHQMVTPERPHDVLPAGFVVSVKAGHDSARSFRSHQLSQVRYGKINLWTGGSLFHVS